MFFMLRFSKLSSVISVFACSNTHTYSLLHSTHSTLYNRTQTPHIPTHSLAFLLQYNYDQQSYDQQYQDQQYGGDGQQYDGAYNDQTADPLATWQEGQYGEWGGQPEGQYGEVWDGEGLW